MLADVIFDTNFLRHLKKIDPNFDLIELIGNSYFPSTSVRNVGSHRQFNNVDYLIPLIAKISDHAISDEELTMFIMLGGYKGKVNLIHVAKDPDDIKFIIYSQNNTPSMFLTCEKKLLQLSKELHIPHSCIKATIHHLDEHIGRGGIFNDSDFNTDEMFNPDGIHPPYHYHRDKNCPQCHDNCRTHKFPPNLTLN